MERPINSIQPPPATLFSQVLDPPTKGQGETPAIIGIPQQEGMLRLQGRAHPFLHMAPTRLPIHLPRSPTVPTFPSTRALAMV